MQKRVSVIVAARNEEKRIKRCIDSLAAALGPHDEIIVVNDGSTDGTKRELAKFGNEIQVVTNEVSLGRAASRNAGILVANGRYVAIQDADDEALPGRIEIPVGMLERNQRLVAASGQCIAVTSRGVYWRHNSYPTRSQEVKDQLESSIMAVCHTGSVIRRRALDEVGLYDPTFVRAQDLDLFKRLSKLGPIESSPIDTVLYTHNVWLSWSYWKLSRKHHDAISGRAALPVPLMILRYLLAMARRSLRLFTTHLAARAAVTRVLAVNR